MSQPRYTGPLSNTVFTTWAEKASVGRGRFTDQDSEHCRDCGLPVGIWWEASDRLWERIMDRDDGGGVVCAGCFDARASKKSIVLRWEASDEIRR